MRNIEDNEQLNYKVSKHAQERYVERMMGYTDKTQISQYITCHSIKIKENLNKFIKFGEKIYEGKIRGHPFTHIYCNNHWVVFVDPKNETITTLYKLCYGLNEEFSKGIINEYKNTIRSLASEKDEKAKLVETRVVSLKEKIKDNEEKINQYKSLINQLTEANEGHDLLIKNADLELNEIQTKIDNTVEFMVAKKVF